MREFLKNKLRQASVSRIQIDRPAKNAHITIHTARPGLVIGKKGEDIDALRKEVAARMGIRCISASKRSASRNSTPNWSQKASRSSWSDASCSVAP